jgi:transmembrane sensor
MSPPREQRESVVTQAAEWLQRLEQDEFDAVQRRKFRRWMRKPAHVQELAQLCLLDAVLHHTPLKTESWRERANNVIPFESFGSVIRPRGPQPSVAPPAPRFSAWKIAAAASVLLAMLVASAVSLTPRDQAIVTHAGHWDRQMLDDGSVVRVGPGTELRFHFDDQARAVTLVRGEALFDVAKDPSRPFVVMTDAGTVQAIGTEFATVDVGDEVIVTVAEGKVAVTAAMAAAGRAPMLPLEANRQVVLSQSGAGEPTEVDAEFELKWLLDWYEYDGERVDEIIAQLNSRNATQVTVNDPRVLRLHMSSLAFKPSQPEDFVAKINEWYAASRKKTDDPTRPAPTEALRLNRP